MSFRYGFYNSIRGDRKYDAEDFGRMFDGLIGDGVFGTIGGGMIVRPAAGLSVLVKSGKAWFDHTWNWLNADLPLAVSDPNSAFTRIDAVVLEVNPITRINEIYIIDGTASPNPAKPILTEYQHCLAYITVRSGVTSLSSSDIEIVVGTAETPLVTGMLQLLNLDILIDRYNTQWGSEFHEWLSHLRNELDENQAANLQNQIDDMTRYLENWKLGDIKETVRPSLGENWRLCNGDYISSDEAPEFTDYMVKINDKGQVYHAQHAVDIPTDVTSLAVPLTSRTLVRSTRRNELFVVSNYRASDKGGEIRKVLVTENGLEATDQVIEVSETVTQSYVTRTYYYSFDAVFYDDVSDLLIVFGHRSGKKYIGIYSGYDMTVGWENMVAGSDPDYTFTDTTPIFFCKNRKVVWTTTGGTKIFIFDITTHAVTTISNIRDRLSTIRSVAIDACHIDDKFIFFGTSSPSLKPPGTQDALYAAIFDENFSLLAEIPIAVESTFSNLYESWYTQFYLIRVSFSKNYFCVSTELDRYSSSAGGTGTTIGAYQLLFRFDADTSQITLAHQFTISGEYGGKRAVLIEDTNNGIVNGITTIEDSNTNLYWRYTNDDVSDSSIVFYDSEGEPSSSHVVHGNTDFTPYTAISSDTFIAEDGILYLSAPKVSGSNYRMRLAQYDIESYFVKLPTYVGQTESSGIRAFIRVKE